MKTESTEQTILVARVRSLHPELLLMSIPNGGRRDPKAAAAMKREGVLAGAPDLFLAEPRLTYHGLFIEMKRQKGGRTSTAQDAIITRLKDNGYAVVVCAGADIAYSYLIKYVYGDDIPKWLIKHVNI